MLEVKELVIDFNPLPDDIQSLGTLFSCIEVFNACDYLPFSKILYKPDIPINNLWAIIQLEDKPFFVIPVPYPSHIDTMVLNGHDGKEYKFTYQETAMVMVKHIFNNGFAILKMPRNQISDPLMRKFYEGLVSWFSKNGNAKKMFLIIDKINHFLAEDENFRSRAIQVLDDIDF